MLCEERIPFPTGCIATLLVLFLLTLSVNSQNIQAAKVAFVQDGQIIVSRLDGQNLKVLTHNKEIKYEPRWSPNGEQLLYIADTSNENTLGDIVIINTETGQELSRFPILKMDGNTILNDTRGAEDAGWISDSEVFVIGSPGPWYEELESFDSRTGRILRQLDGHSFAICPKKGTVAQFFSDSDIATTEIDVDQKVVFSEHGNRNDDYRDLHWDSSCDRLAFLKFKSGNYDKGEFVVLHGVEVESRNPLPPDLTKGDIYLIAGTFLVKTPSGHYAAYDSNSKRLVPPQPRIDTTLQMQQTMRKSVKEMGSNGQEDYWPLEPHLSQ